MQQGDAEEQDKQTLSKCELMYQILQGVLHIPEQEMEKLRFFPEDHTFSKVLDVSAYYR